MSCLRILVFDDGAGVCLYVRLPGAHRMLVDCQRKASRAFLAILRDLGELGPLTPLSQYLRPQAGQPEWRAWLQALSLLRGLVLRPGGSWIVWKPEPVSGPGFRLSARVIPRLGPTAPPLESNPPPLLVLGLSANEIEELGGPPAAWAANSTLALKIALPGAASMIVGGDLRPAAWQRLLSDRQLRDLLIGSSFFAAGSPERGYDLSRGLKMAALPWLLMGGMDGCLGWRDLQMQKSRLITPGVGALLIDVDQQGVLEVQAWPWADNSLVWQGFARPISDNTLPAPWPLRRALADMAEG